MADDANSWLDEFREETDSQLGEAPEGFLLDELLGRGGMAEVYLAHRTGPQGFSRKVVIKRIRPDKVNEQSFVDRFIREASIASKFHHPNIVEVSELVTLDDTYYIVMEYLHGKNIDFLIESCRKSEIHFPLEFAVYIAAGVASGLAYAHAFDDRDTGRMHQIVHRDISPDNVMVTYGGEVKVLDFGVAKDLDGTQLTQGDQVIGKPLYLPPESLEGAPATPGRDVYALGMSLYVMVAGRPPFEMSSGPEGLAKLLMDISSSTAPSPREFNPTIPADLEYMIMRSISKDPRERFAAGDLRTSLEGWLVSNGHSVTATQIAEFVRDRAPVEESVSTGPVSKPLKQIGGAKPKKGWEAKSVKKDTEFEAYRPEPTSKIRITDRERVEAAKTGVVLAEPTAMLSPGVASEGAPQATTSGTGTVVFEKEPKLDAVEEVRDRGRMKRRARKAPKSDPERNRLLIGGIGLVAAIGLFTTIGVFAFGGRDHDAKAAFKDAVSKIGSELEENPDTVGAVEVRMVKPEPTPTPVPEEPDPVPEDVAPPPVAKTARLAIRCDGSNVFVDGKPKGFCGMQALVVRVTPGTHLVEVESTRGRLRKTVEAVAGRRVVVSLKKPRRKRAPAQDYQVPVGE
ncbi:MAG: serine/threonine-protein kinase [Myxococcota bacterium]